MLPSLARLSRLARLGTLVLVMASTAAVAWAADKRGIGLADRSAADRVQQLKVSWYYTWSPSPMQDPVDAEFVPMVWGGNRLKDQMAELERGPRARVLLALNEPDNVTQATMSVQDAVAVWPRLSAAAQRISSPATTSVDNGWSKRFDQQVKAKGLRVDFVAVHLYTPPDVRKFLQRLDAIHAMYGKPIWITEFAVADWQAHGKPGANRYSEQEVARFVRELLPELDRRDYVERYAWFGAGKLRRDSNEATRTSRLFDSQGKLTDVGRAYAGL